MEAIDSIKIVQVDGLTGAGGQGSDGEAMAGGNLASNAVSAALRYRAQAPIVDGLMKELGFDGSTLENLVASVTPDKPRHESADRSGRSRKSNRDNGRALPTATVFTPEIDDDNRSDISGKREES